MADQEKSQRGFRVLAERDPELQREIASLGGQAAQRSQRAHRFSHEEAVEAGRKGGSANRQTN